MTWYKMLFTRALSAVWCCSATVALSGCVATTNGRPVVFETTTHGQVDAPAVSVTRLSRNDWPITQVSVPAGNVAHQPTYAADFNVKTVSSRRAGTYPTIDTAILSGRDNGSAQIEGFVAYPHVAFLVLKAPFEMIGGEWPWSIVTSGPEYERTREH